MERIGFGLRFGAALIDLVIVIGVLMVLGFGEAMSPLGAGMGVPVPGYTTLLFVAFLPLLYSTFEIFKAASPGKMLLKLVICKDDGTPAPKDVLVKRWAVKYSNSLLNLLAALTTIGVFRTLGTFAGLIIFVGCFFVLAEARQAFHDKLAKTAVYKKN